MSFSISIDMTRRTLLHGHTYIKNRLGRRRTFLIDIPSGEVKYTDVCSVCANYKVRLTHTEEYRIAFCFGEGQQLLDSTLSKKR